VLHKTEVTQRRRSSRDTTTTNHDNMHIIIMILAHVTLVFSRSVPSRIRMILHCLPINYIDRVRNGSMWLKRS
jgi:hypothetical protein